MSLTDLNLSKFGLGTWAFGSDRWWGPQDDRVSQEVIERAVSYGVTLFDTAPVYGRGHSEELLGRCIKAGGFREKVLLATKLGLSWQENGPKIFHDLSPERMVEELDESRRRLSSDYIDIYQIHWPDKDKPVKETAGQMHEFYRKKIIRFIGVSNFSVTQIREFLEYCPVHFSQQPYNMFKRDIEADLLPFCRETGIGTLAYIPLHSGILTGKYFLKSVPVPNDICRRNHRDLRGSMYDINKGIINELSRVALRYRKSLAQLAINWVGAKTGVSSVLVGSRNVKQLEENTGGLGWEIFPEDQNKIEQILEARLSEIKALSRSKK